MSSKGEMYQHAKHSNNSVAFAVARSQCQSHCLAIENATGGREMGGAVACGAVQRTQRARRVVSKQKEPESEQ